MSTVQRIEAFVRRDRIPGVLHALRDSGASRFYVTKVHAHGSGVDPEDVSVSLEEGEGYTEKARIEALCEEERVPSVLEAVRRVATTGHRGDGIVLVSPVVDVLSIRTGDRDALALL